VNLGSLVLGVLNGLLIGLLAVGLVLVYKSNRFLNLAHAQLGTVSALLLAKFVLDWGWSWWPSAILAVTIGVATGIVVDRAFVSRLRARTSSTVSLLLLTVGVTQLLLALTFIPDLGADPNTLADRGFPVPFESHVHIGDVFLGGEHLLIAFLVPVLVAVLAVFLKFSTLGKMIRAAATNPDAARLCGISTARVSTITWAIAGGLSAVTAILRAPSQGTFNAASLGPELLLYALGAAAVGAFVSLPLALGGGLLLGVVSQITLAETSNGGTAQLVTLLLILAVLFVRGRAIAAAFAAGGAVVEDRAPVRVPDVVRNRLVVRRRRLWLGGLSLLIAALAPVLPYFHTEGHRFQLALVLIYALVGVSLTMLVGWAGQISLGHIALVGVGAFVTARLSPHGWSLPLLLLAAGVTGAALLVLVGLPALRVRGLTLAVTTLGLGVVAQGWLFRRHWVSLGKPLGIEVRGLGIMRGVRRPESQLAAYYVALIVLVVAVLAASALRRSLPGRIVVAVRDNERAAASFGLTPATTKLAVLAVSGFFAAMAGVLWAEAWRNVGADQFSPEISFAILAVPIIGGLGSVPGAVAGAVLIYAPTFFLSPHLAGLFGSFGHQIGFQLALGGLGLVIALLNYPSGIAGAAEQAWSWFVGRIAASVARDDAAEATSLPLEVDAVSVHFGGLRALDEASITVRPGEIVGLIGPNGAGKTTLLDAVSGVLRPDAGAIRLAGHDVTSLAPDFRPAYGLGRSFQDSTLFHGLTVTETIQVALSRQARVGVVASMLNAPWARATERSSRAQAAELIERFGLTPWADTLASELSTGLRRICGLAAQVAAAPSVLLLDEPTAGVAQREAEAFGPLLRRIRDDLGCSILIVEHDMPLLMGLCDRVYALESGRVIAEGTPAEVRADPRVVASYLGTDETAIDRSGSTAPRTRARKLTAAKGSS
jgi:ABC-type branched-subunit amino acid transport system ATPase component/ABC-type branched-subunit amino acid transport system permease subunit